SIMRLTRVRHTRGPIARRLGRLCAAAAMALCFVYVVHAADGVLDPTFGTAGVVRTHFGSVFDYARGVAIDADGKIVVAGATGDLFTHFFAAAARYNQDGTP